MRHASTDQMPATMSSVSAVSVAERKTRLPPFGDATLVLLCATLLSGGSAADASIAASTIGVRADVSVVGAADKVGMGVVGRWVGAGEINLLDDTCTSASTDGAIVGATYAVECTCTSAAIVGAGDGTGTASALAVAISPTTTPLFAGAPRTSVVAVVVVTVDAAAPLAAALSPADEVKASSGSSALEALASASLQSTSVPPSSLSGETTTKGAHTRAVVLLDRSEERSLMLAPSIKIAPKQTSAPPKVATRLRPPPHVATCSALFGIIASNGEGGRSHMTAAVFWVAL